MNWLRLYVFVEGPTERQFLGSVLTCHLAQFFVDVRPRVVVTNRKKGKRGGVMSYANFRSDVDRTMRDDTHSDAYFTTMIDLYRLPSDFPGRAATRGRSNPVERVSLLEQALGRDLGHPRFIPHIQLHEFESLLFCDLAQLDRRIDGASKGLKKLGQEVAQMAPEEIDEGPATAPSKRIIKHVPSYEKAKVRVGAPAAAAIPLPELRTKCPHFDAWIGQLEHLRPIS